MTKSGVPSNSVACFKAFPPRMCGMTTISARTTRISTPLPGYQRSGHIDNTSHTTLCPPVRFSSSSKLHMYGRDTRTHVLSEPCGIVTSRNLLSGVRWSRPRLLQTPLTTLSTSFHTGCPLCAHRTIQRRAHLPGIHCGSGPLPANRLALCLRPQHSKPRQPTHALLLLPEVPRPPR